MKNGFLFGLAAIAAMACSGSASADAFNNIYSVTVSEGLGQAGGFDTANGNPFTCGAANTACASFIYTGPLNFTNNAAQNSPPTGDTNASFGFSSSSVSAYMGSGAVTSSGSQVANFANLAGFLNSSASANGYPYGSYFTFDLGVLSAGTVLTITHDDGISLFQGASRIGSTVSGPTAVTTDTVTLGTSGDTILRYARENGTPSILTARITAPVPEPASWAMMIAGFGAIGFAMRRQIRRSDAKFDARIKQITAGELV